MPRAASIPYYRPLRDALNYFKQKHDLIQDHHSHKPAHIVSGILAKHNIDDIGDVDTAKDVKTTSVKPPTQKKDVYADYIHNPDDKPSGISEHEYFQNAKKMLVKHHHEKVTKMMKEWAAARQHVHDMKLTDPKGSDKLNREITAKTYEALEEEGDAEKKQLIAIHQQRVQAKLNVKKRHSMEHYMAVLTEPKPDAAKILKALKHYLRVEEKDRVHSINHYKHVRDTENADAAEVVRQRTMTHLKILTQRIQQAIDMLSRVPAYEKKIRAQIDTFLQTFHNVDVLVANLIEKPDKTNNDKILRKYKEELQQTKDTKHVNNKSVKEVTTAKPAVLHHISLKKTPLVIPANKFDDETMEDEHNLPTVDIKKSSHVAHMSVSQLKLQEQAYVKKEAMKGANAVQTGSTLGIVIGSITVFIVIIVGVVILRQRSMTPSSRGFVEVAQNASVEERHVTKMQMNGYENPTYKYFEAKPAATANA
ncbi:hypothetical protein NP493_68g04015 [Ridgeia piscesae]|uniref:E2 domain-containing protein n=1 Tax=Ridgeia piscesae TaxID=27915 RepID=A0AAD9P9Z2_RIDPI|nr:hypothetical protein NP493_68g04015 [Ridgeia piscesae]